MACAMVARGAWGVRIVRDFIVKATSRGLDQKMNSRASMHMARRLGVAHSRSGNVLYPLGREALVMENDFGTSLIQDIIS